MMIRKLTAFITEPVVAKIYNHKKNGKMYYNVKHGSSSKNASNDSDLWSYSLGLAKNHFPVNEDVPELDLDGDDYIITTVKVNGEIMRDKKGNVLYNISRDKTDVHKKDIILLWEIPNKNYVDVKYVAEGTCTILGEGISGKERGDVIYSSPAPVIEILGDVTLTWTGRYYDNNTYKKVSQVIKYNYANNSWDIKPIITGEDDE